MLGLGDDFESFSKLNLDLLARQVVEGFITGLHKSPFHGFSVEFAEHRLYNSGDSVKNIDWKLYARTDKLFSKRYEEETNLRCRILLDVSPSMYFPEKGASKMTFSVYCAAALIELLKRQRDAFGLSVFSDTISFRTPARSTAAHQKLLYFELDKLLQQKRGQGNSFITRALHEEAEKTHKRSLVVVFSDMMDTLGNDDELFSALQHLKHNKHEVILFHVNDKEHELDFTYGNRPYVFVDVESGQEVKAYPNEIKEMYINSMNNYLKELRLRCGQYKIDFVDADINQGFYPVLQSYLIKRNRLS